MLRCRRVLVVLFALALMLPAFAVGTRAQEIVPVDSEFYFESDDGSVVFSDVTFSFVEAGYGHYIGVLTVIPTQQEIDNLLEDGWSHVDFEFRFRGLEPSGDGIDFAPAVSDYARQAGARIDVEDGYVVYYAMGLNIQKRWSPGEPLNVYAPISGFQPDGERNVSASVEVVSAKWWFADGDCETAYSRETNDILLEYCTVQDDDSRAVLYNEDGRTKFRLKQD